MFLLLQNVLYLSCGFVYRFIQCDMLILHFLLCAERSTQLLRNVHL